MRDRYHRGITNQQLASISKMSLRAFGQQFLASFPSASCGCSRRSPISNESTTQPQRCDCFGERGCLARSFPPLAENNLPRAWGPVWNDRGAPEAVGETPTAATGTVALPILNYLAWLAPRTGHFIVPLARANSRKTKAQSLVHRASQGLSARSHLHGHGDALQSRTQLG